MTTIIELTIHTSDRGPVRRMAETIDQAQQIRDEWARYATTTAINVTEDGAEVESLTYSREDEEPKKHPMLADDWDATLYVRDEAKESQIVSAGQQVRNLRGNDEFGYFALVSRDGRTWYRYGSSVRPTLRG